MKPIYIPSGAAKEYGDYAINIYTGCPHRCYYCFAPTVLHKDREVFHSVAEPRKNIVEAVKRQLDREQITGKLIHLCFTCDPYPMGYDSTPTREIIKAIKAGGNNVQILTKNGLDAERDFDLLDASDWFGVTYAGYELGEVLNGAAAEPGAGPPHMRLRALKYAHDLGVKTWISMEPVLDAEDTLDSLELSVLHIDRYKIGKLNYWPSDIDWKGFGQKVEEKCRLKGIDYYIKDSLRKEMEGSK